MPTRGISRCSVETSGKVRYQKETKRRNELTGLISASRQCRTPLTRARAPIISLLGDLYGRSVCTALKVAFNLSERVSMTVFFLGDSTPLLESSQDEIPSRSGRSRRRNKVALKPSEADL
ncbi:hypothetical protein KM043_009151 [Ampulex compressa]|nr:hypothetical protein KM043_009151 [Ampulex compressa]